MLNFLRKLLSPVKPPAQIEPVPPMPVSESARYVVQTFRDTKKKLEANEADEKADIEERRQRDLYDLQRWLAKQTADNHLWALERLTELGLSADEIGALLSEGE